MASGNNTGGREECVVLWKGERLVLNEELLGQSALEIEKILFQARIPCAAIGDLVYIVAKSLDEILSTGLFADPRKIASADADSTLLDPEILDALTIQSSNDLDAVKKQIALLVNHPEKLDLPQFFPEKMDLKAWHIWPEDHTRVQDPDTTAPATSPDCASTDVLPSDELSGGLRLQTIPPLPMPPEL